MRFLISKFHGDSWLYGFLIFLFIATPEISKAETIRCDITRWRGTTEIIAISWVGFGFEVEPDKKRARIIDEGGVTKWIGADVRHTSEFTAFVTATHNYVDPIQTLRVRYSFFVYHIGKCETRVDINGYLSIIGNGRLDLL